MDHRADHGVGWVWRAPVDPGFSGLPIRPPRTGENSSPLRPQRRGDSDRHDDDVSAIVFAEVDSDGEPGAQDPDGSRSDAADDDLSAIVFAEVDPGDEPASLSETTSESTDSGPAGNEDEAAGSARPLGTAADHGGSVRETFHLPFGERRKALDGDQRAQLAGWAADVADRAARRYRAGEGGLVVHVQGGGNGGRLSDGAEVVGRTRASAARFALQSEVQRQLRARAVPETMVDFLPATSRGDALVEGLPMSDKAARRVVEIRIEEHQAAGPSRSVAGTPVRHAPVDPGLSGLPGPDGDRALLRPRRGTDRPIPEVDAVNTVVSASEGQDSGGNAPLHVTSGGPDATSAPTPPTVAVEQASPPELPHSEQARYEARFEAWKQHRSQMLAEGAPLRGSVAEAPQIPALPAAAETPASTQSRRSLSHAGESDGSSRAASEPSERASTDGASLTTDPLSGIRIHELPTDHTDSSELNRPGTARSPSPIPDPARVGRLTHEDDGSWSADGSRILITELNGDRRGLLIASLDPTARPVEALLPPGDQFSVVVRYFGVTDTGTQLMQVPVERADGSHGEVLLSDRQLSQIVGSLTGVEANEQPPATESSAPPPDVAWAEAQAQDGAPVVLVMLLDVAAQGQTSEWSSERSPSPSDYDADDSDNVSDDGKRTIPPRYPDDPDDADVSVLFRPNRNEPASVFLRTRPESTKRPSSLPPRSPSDSGGEFEDTDSASGNAVSSSGWDGPDDTAQPRGGGHSTALREVATPEYADDSWVADPSLVGVTERFSSELLGGVPVAQAEIATIGQLAGPVPDPRTFRTTGRPVGTHGSEIFVDEDGQFWLVKRPEIGDEFVTAVQQAAARLLIAVGLGTPEVYVFDNGRMSVQRWLDDAEEFEFAELSEQDVVTLLKHHIVDWLMSNHDAHPGQFLRTRDGTIVAIDKDQSLKYLGRDELDPNFHPNAYYGTREPVYNTLWADFFLGHVVLPDPRTGELGDFIGRLQEIPEADMRALLWPYAEQATRAGKLMSTSGEQPDLSEERPVPNDPEALFSAVVARKNDLAYDFGDLYDIAQWHSFGELVGRWGAANTGDVEVTGRARPATARPGNR